MSRPVRWAHTSELIDPTPFLSGGELLLTNALQLDDPDVQRAYIRRLHDKDIAGLGIGIGVNIAEVPETMIETAGEIGFPLYEVPYDVPFIAITEQAFHGVAAEQNEVLRRAMRAHERLEHIVLSEEGLPALVTTLASQIEGTVIVFDGRAQILARADHVNPQGRTEIDSITAELRERQANGSCRQFIPGHSEADGRSLALPILPTGDTRDDALPLAWIVATRETGPLREFDRLALRQAVTVVALELLRARVARETEWRLASTLLADMARGLVSGRDLSRQLERFGLTGAITALVIRKPEPGVSLSGAAEASLAAAVRAEPGSAVVAAYGQLLTVLAGGPRTEDESVGLAERIRTRVADDLRVPLRIGVGRPVDATEARTTFHEARCALEALTLANGRARGRLVATHKDLGSFRFLLALQNDEELRQFSETILRPIQDNEAYADELTQSLEVYIEEGGHWERSSKRLFCHRHTLRYRIRKIEELTGRSLAAASDRMEFWLALRAARFYR